MRIPAVPLLLIACVLAPAVGRAQSPWSITLAESLNPLPIGLCGAVHLTIVDPATKEAPRNAAQYHVTVSHFDLSAGGAAVAGYWVDAEHFDVCACHASKAGEIATVTAHYPAQTLAPAARVRDARGRDIAFDQTATFVIGAQKGAIEPAACVAQSALPAAAPTRGAPVATAPAATSGAPVPAGGARAAQPANAPLAGSARSAPVAMPGVAVTGTPASANLAWAAVPGVASYVVTRRTAGTGPVEQTLAATNVGWYDSGLQPATLYTYTVRAVLTDGREGSAEATFTTPPAVNPSGLSATQPQPGQVRISWQAVAGASYYVVFGPGAGGGTKVTGNSQMLTGIPAGLQEWTVATFYEPGPVSSPATAFSRASLTVTAPPATAPAAAPASGRYRVTLTGWRAIKASYDDQLSRDGMGDETFAAVYVRRYDRNTGNLSLSSALRTPIYGDTRNFGTRQRAGSMSPTGGIADGNQVPAFGDPAVRGTPPTDTVLPFRLWEGTLADGGDALVLSPSLWEVDGSNQLYDFWLEQMGSLSDVIYTYQEVQSQITNRRIAPVIAGSTVLETTAPPPQAPTQASAPPPAAPQSSSAPPPSGSASQNPVTKVAGAVAQGAKAAVTAVATGAKKAVVVVATAAQEAAQKAKSAASAAVLGIKSITQGGMDRPIGVYPDGPNFSLPNSTVVLTRESIEAGLAPLPAGTAPLALPAAWPRMPKPGVVMIPFLDGTSSAGIVSVVPARYELYITVERMP